MRREDCCYKKETERGDSELYRTRLLTKFPSTSQFGFTCYLRIENAEGYVLIAVYLFVCVLFA